MPKENKYNPKTIRGINIYHDDKNTIYMPFLSNTAYILTPSNTKHYVNYIVGYLAALVIFEVVLIFSKNTLLSLLAGIGVLIVNYLFFYFNFLKKAIKIEDYELKKKDNFIRRQAKELDYNRIYTLIVCCILLVLILVFYCWWQKLEGVYYYVTLMMIVAAAIYGIINVIILICKNKFKL